LKKNTINKLLIALHVYFLAAIAVSHASDTVKIQTPKHYFHQTLNTDYYATGERKLDTINTISKRLNSYKISQFSIGYCAPIFTKNYYKKDSTSISNLHILLTTSYSRVNLDFSGISQHYLSKFSIGGRVIYNNGKKSIFFAELSPFTTKDVGYSYTKTTRFANTFIYNYTANDYFSFRIGYTRLFFLGNRYSLPYIGIRVGKLDRMNLSIQFPRAITLTIPMGTKIKASLFTRPQGGLYTFANKDSLQIGNINDNRQLYFGRYEFLSGARIDIKASNSFNIYLSSGFTTRNKILFHYASPASKATPYKKNYNEDIKSSIFLNLGLVIRFGKTKSIYNNRMLYEAMNINNTITSGDNTIFNGNGDIPSPNKRIPASITSEINDLIEVQDLY
jgi:hypothetical protein